MAGRRRLNGFVPIHRENGEITWYGPEDDVPAKDAKLIGDHAWADSAEPVIDGAPAPAGD